MKTSLFLGALLIVATSHLASAQFSGGFGGNANSGNAGGGGAYRDPGSSPAQNERAKRQAGYYNNDGFSTFIEGSVLMNVKADEYVAVFGVSEEGATPEAAGTKMDATVANFKAGIKALGIADDDVFVDFVVQNRIYTYTFDKATDQKGATAREDLSGFVLKKNISIHFKDKTLVDQLAVIASRFGIYDLIKVDYLVKDREAIQARLQLQTMGIIRRKADLYTSALGFKTPAPAQVVLDKPSVYYPIEQYDSYKAAEEETIDVPSSNYIVQHARKTSTTFFNPLSGADFDAVINPTIIEPTVQFTTYIKVRYAELPKSKKSSRGFGN